MVAQLGEYTKNQWIVRFQRVNFMVRELYHTKAVIFLKQNKESAGIPRPGPQVPFHKGLMLGTRDSSVQWEGPHVLALFC